jgi:hypothetical protein
MEVYYTVLRNPWKILENRSHLGHKSKFSKNIDIIHCLLMSIGNEILNERQGKPQNHSN